VILVGLNLIELNEKLFANFSEKDRTFWKRDPFNVRGYLRKNVQPSLED